jgi:hypothetical protein
MEVFAEQRIEAVSALVARPHQARMLHLVLGGNQDAASVGGCACPRRELREQMLLRLVVDRVRSIEPEAVHVEFADPILDVREHQLADVHGARSVEVD